MEKIFQTTTYITNNYKYCIVQTIAFVLLCS